MVIKQSKQNNGYPKYAHAQLTRISEYINLHGKGVMKGADGNKVIWPSARANHPELSGWAQCNHKTL